MVNHCTTGNLSGAATPYVYSVLSAVCRSLSMGD